MRLSPYWTCLWPGLPALWFKGDLWALAWAIPFAGLLNVALAASCLWPELLAEGWAGKLWMLAAAWWCAGAGHAAWRMESLLGAAIDRTAEDLFRQAQSSYLRGNYFETEATLVRLLAAWPDDIEARLLLATLLRRTERPDEASKQLETLMQYEAAARWQMEIDSELRLMLAEAEEETGTEENGGNGEEGENEVRRAA